MKILRYLPIALLFCLVAISNLNAASTAVYLGSAHAPTTQIANADGTSPVALWVCPASGGKIVALNAASSDPVDRDVLVTIINSATGKTTFIMTATVPANSGSAAGAPATAFFDPSLISLPIDQNGTPYLFCENNQTIQVQARSTVTNFTVIYFYAVAGGI